MEITLIINPGSSSKKFALYKNNISVLNAHVERTKDGFEMCTTINGTQQKNDSKSQHKFHESLNNFIDFAKENLIIQSASEINNVVVRVVAPGTPFQEHAEITDFYVKKLRDKEHTAPLHIPHIVSEIETVRKLLPDVKITAASDSAFHSTIPDHIRRFSLSENKVKNHDIYRFGYHGLSVASVVRRVHAVTGVEAKKTIVCHIGSGVSITAVKNEKSFDTTMGYAPGSGLLMGSRAGDLDTGALLTIMQAQNMKPLDAQTFIQNEGGLYGISGEEDLRLVLERRMQGDKTAKEAIQAYVYHIQKAIGGYMAVMGGLDLLVFTATAGERSSILRCLIVEELSGLGINLDSEKNELCVSRDGVISPSGADIKVAVIKTGEADEMLRVSQGGF